VKTDTLFYQLFQEFPWIFFQLIQQDQIDLNAYQFIAPEIKQRSFRLDGLFKTTEEEPDLPLYFVEAQFYYETDFYDRLFPSIFLYFGQYKPINTEWFVVVIFDKQSNDVTIPSKYREIAEQRLQRIYLDAMPKGDSTSLGLGILKLVVEPEERAGELARNLIERTKQEFTDNQSQKQLLELVETIIIYKFPRLSYEEIETMLNLEEIKQTRVYQDAKSEGKAEGKLEQKLATIALLQELGLNVEQIAQRLEIEESLVRQHLR
jgi:predicted transposase/invertase (TIGR01784 family)